MADPTRVPIAHQRAIRQLEVFVRNAPKTALSAADYLRATRSRLRMSQRELAQRSGIPQANIARIEKGLIDPRLSTLRRLYDAMECELLVLPRPRKRLGDALADRYMRRTWRGLWED